MALRRLRRVQEERTTDVTPQQAQARAKELAALPSLENQAIAYRAHVLTLKNVRLRRCELFCIVVLDPTCWLHRHARYGGPLSGGGGASVGLAHAEQFARNVYDRVPHVATRLAFPVGREAFHLCVFAGDEVLSAVVDVRAILDARNAAAKILRLPSR
jgi:hypothetical protein